MRSGAAGRRWVGFCDIRKDVSSPISCELSSGFGILLCTRYDEGASNQRRNHCKLVLWASRSRLGPRGRAGKGIFKSWQVMHQYRCNNNRPAVRVANVENEDVCQITPFPAFSADIIAEGMSMWTSRTRFKSSARAVFSGAVQMSDMASAKRSMAFQ